jgi:CheY-like chemotaxis protein
MKKYNGLDCILLVDDDETSNFINKTIIELEEIDAFIQIANDGIEALEYLTCTGKFSEKSEYPQPGIILLDINMPRMNGWEFMAEYKKLPENQKGRIVLAMLTSSLDQGDIDKANKNKDLMGLINKPLNPEKLNTIIKQHFT